ncbi:MAG: cyclodeaminase/cyclohydrolase family protein [Desulfobacterales bacterium]|nr:cyclodeaminase/cyclohydrolase family protein [Desulfobacterales bacterium]
MLSDLSVKGFMAETASKSPAPGGGSMAALSAAAAASLAEMVANLTMGKKGFEDVEEEMKAIGKKASGLREALVEDIDRDSDAFDQVMAAFKLPRETGEEKAERSRAIQDAFMHAAMIPLGVARSALALIDLAGKAVQIGNKNAVTDGAVGVMMARTAVLSALYNVKINLTSIKDPDFVREVSQETARLEAEAMEKEREMLSHVGL